MNGLILNCFHGFVKFSGEKIMFKITKNNKKLVDNN